MYHATVYVPLLQCMYHGFGVCTMATVYVPRLRCMYHGYGVCTMAARAGEDVVRGELEVKVLPAQETVHESYQLQDELVLT